MVAAADDPKRVGWVEPLRNPSLPHRQMMGIASLNPSYLSERSASECTTDALLRAGRQLQRYFSVVMAGLVPAIHVFGFGDVVDMDARNTPGHDGLNSRVTLPLTFVTI